MSKRVLITGGAGFIGHHIIEHILTTTDWDVVSLDRLDTSGTLDRIVNVLDKNPSWKSRITVVWHDLKASLNDLVRKKIGDVHYVLHLAAGSHVDRSIDYPMEFVMDNVVGTCNLLDYAREHLTHCMEKFLYFSTDEVFGPADEGVNYMEWARYNSGNPYSASKAGAEELCLAYANSYKMPIFITHCHDEETKCWTEDGIKPVEELKVGQMVWTLQNNKKLKLEPVQEIVHEHYNGEMIGFCSNKYDLLVTPNHRMLSRKRGEKEYSVIQASQLAEAAQKNRHYIPLSGKWNGKTKEIIDISEFISKNNHHNAKKIPMKYNAYDLMYFLGWYLSEGSTNKKGSISIAQDEYSKLKNCIAIKDVIKKLGFNPKTYGSNIQFCSVTFEEFLSQFGYGAANKTIPSWVMNLDNELLAVLFKSLMEGDGSVQKSYKRYYTKSTRLAEQVAEIAIKLGYSAAIKTRTTWNPQKTKLSQSYYVSIRKAVGGLEKQHVYKTEYKGKVWCVRTNSGNFFTSRNGEISCSGNTMNVFGIRQHPEKFIPLVMRKVELGEKVFIHANATCTEAGKRHYINTADVASGVMFLLKHGCKGDKYNLVGERELDNLELAQMIAALVGKPLIYELVDFHSSRPGHDLRYALNGDKMKDMGWAPQKSVDERLKEVVAWTFKNKYWLGL